VPPHATADPVHLPGRLREQRERLGVWRQAAYLAQEMILEPLTQRKRFGPHGAAGELVGRVLGTEFHQRERVIAGVRQDAVDGLRVEGSIDHQAEELTRLGVGQAVHPDRRKLLEYRPCGRLADAGDEAHAVRIQAAGDETEHLRRSGIEPVRVIDDAQQRLRFTRPGEQSQRRQAHQEPLRRRSCVLSERGPERVPLRRTRAASTCRPQADREAPACRKGHRVPRPRPGRSPPARSGGQAARTPPATDHPRLAVRPGH